MRKVKFIPINDLTEKIINEPKPAKNFLPSWYKNLLPHMVQNKNPRFPSMSIEKNLTAKKCMPLLDSMTYGYVATLPCDIFFVDPAEYGHRILWDVSYSPVQNHHIDQVGDMSFPPGYEGGIFKWMFPFIIKTPPGYSCMFVHPSHHYNMPFFSINGIVDTDFHTLPVNIPFFLKKDFIGKIEKNTPIFQIIPFKRESWLSSKTKNKKENLYIFDDFNSIMEGSYKKRFWNKKIFQ
jgi:hypothetical protein